MLLSTIYFLKVCSAGAAPTDTAIFYITKYTNSKVIIMTFYLRMALL